VSKRKVFFALVFARWRCIEATMSKDPIPPKIDKLRRNQRIVKRQIESRTADLEKANESLLAEITKLKRRDETARKETEEALHRSRQELRALAARLQAAREEERSALAREIHDELSGTLTALKMDISLLPDRLAKDHKLFAEKLSSMAGLIDRTLARVHAIVTELRPVVLDKVGLVAAIEWQTGEFQERSGIVCESHLPSDEIPLDPGRSTALFRILQEALTNVARHANATKVVVDLKREPGSLTLKVSDNGKGIDKSAIFAPNSLGLLGMRERAVSFGGTTKISALPEGGTVVSVRLPMK
jgi:signal transduction histidine kinase